VTRVLLVHQPIDGGVARHVIDLFEGLRRRGYDAILCGPAVPSASLLNSTVPSDAPHVELQLARAVAPPADIAALRRFSRIVRELRPDVIHAHSSKAGGIARLGRFLHPRIPVLYTPHGYAFAGYFEHELERFAYRQVERGLAHLARFIIAVCGAEGRLAAAVGPSRRVRVVHNGINGSPDGPADSRVLSLAPQGPVICTLTQQRPGKGVETLIDSLPAVVAQHPGAHLVIVGDGPLMGALLDRARGRGVSHAVTFLGEHGDPVAVLRAADIFILPSWAESFPYVILEAMTVGLGIVSTDVGGTSEALEHGRTGLLVPAADASATAAALIRLLADPDLRRRLGEAVQRTVAERFTRKAMVDGVARVYEEALGNGSVRR
jgi:glycosyltransferase involved in cell wall biosynthesis